MTYFMVITLLFVTDNFFRLTECKNKSLVNICKSQSLISTSCNDLAPSSVHINVKIDDNRLIQRCCNFVQFESQFLELMSHRIIANALKLLQPPQTPSDLPVSNITTTTLEFSGIGDNMTFSKLINSTCFNDSNTSPLIYNGVSVSKHLI